MLISVPFYNTWKCVKISKTYKPQYVQKNMKLALHGLNWIWLLLSIFENKYFTESSFFTRHLIGFCFILLDFRPQETQSCCIIGALRGFTNTLCSKAKQMYQIVKLLGSTSVLYPFTERGSYGYHDLTCTREILLHFPDRKKNTQKRPNNNKTYNIASTIFSVYRDPLY